MVRALAAPAFVLTAACGSPAAESTTDGTSGDTTAGTAAAVDEDGNDSEDGAEGDAGPGRTDAGSSDANDDGGDPYACVEIPPTPVVADDILTLRPLRTGPALPHAEVLADLAWLAEDLAHAHSYAGLTDADPVAMLETIGAAAGPTIHRDDLAYQLAIVLAQLGDMHARLADPPRGEAYAPFLLGDAGACVAAFSPDRSALLDAAHPCLVAIDGTPLDDWLTTAAVLATAGSVAMRRDGALRGLRALGLLRALHHAPTTDPVEVTLANEAGTSAQTQTLSMTTQWHAYRGWPHTVSQRTGDDVGYIRIAAMTTEAAADVAATLEAFGDADGWLFDVRGNGGGNRAVTDAVLARLVGADAAPWVSNVAWLRDVGQGDAAVIARGLLPPDAAAFPPSWHAPLRAFVDAFTPCDPLTLPDLTGPYVYAHPRHDAPTFDGPVVVLADGGCASACDVFVSAMASLPGVTIVGSDTAGGSGASADAVLPSTGIAWQRSTMISLQRNGERFDGVGVHVDVAVPPDPTYFVGQSDPALAAAFGVLAEARRSRRRPRH